MAQRLRSWVPLHHAPCLQLTARLPLRRGCGHAPPHDLRLAAGPPAACWLHRRQALLLLLLLPCPAWKALALPGVRRRPPALPLRGTRLWTTAWHIPPRGMSLRGMMCRRCCRLLRAGPAAAVVVAAVPAAVTCAVWGVGRAVRPAHRWPAEKLPQRRCRYSEPHPQAAVYLAQSVPWRYDAWSLARSLPGWPTAASAAGPHWRLLRLRGHAPPRTGHSHGGLRSQSPLTAPAAAHGAVPPRRPARRPHLHPTAAAKASACAAR